MSDIEIMMNALLENAFGELSLLSEDLEMPSNVEPISALELEVYIQDIAPTVSDMYERLVRLDIEITRLPDFICPLLKSVPNIPVCVANQIYDFKSLMIWVKQAQTNPCTRQVLTTDAVYQAAKSSTKTLCDKYVKMCLTQENVDKHLASYCLPQPVSDKQLAAIQSKGMVCSLSGELITNPVLINGSLYEYKNIVDHVNKHNTDPKTNNPLPLIELMLQSIESAKSAYEQMHESISHVTESASRVP